MIRIFAAVFFLLGATVARTQISGIVVDSQTKNPVPFVNVWVEFADIGTTADEDGKFQLIKEQKEISLVFSAVGYETKRLEPFKEADTVFLEPMPFELAEVNVGKRQNCELRLGKIKGKQVSFLQYSKDGKNGKPMIMARYFPNTCNRPIFLKKVKIKPSASAKATFNIRLYSVGEDGAPRDFLYDKNLLNSVGSSVLNKTINLEKLHIPIPETGIFIAIEWLIIEENKRRPQTKYNKTAFTFWEPGITAVENPDNTDTWSNSGGHWKRQPHYSLAIEVEFGD